MFPKYSGIPLGREGLENTLDKFILKRFGSFRDSLFSRDRER